MKLLDRALSRKSSFKELFRRCPAAWRSSRPLWLGLLGCLVFHVSAVSAVGQLPSMHLSGVGHVGTSLRPEINVLEVPIGGYTPLVGFGLTNEFKNERDDIFWAADLSFRAGGTWLGAGGGYFDRALLDTGAAVSLITDRATTNFDLAGNGFDGTESLSLGGATGLLQAVVSDPLGVYVTGLKNRMGSSSSLTLNTSSMVGLTSMSIVSAPPEWTLPSVIGIPVISQFTTFIRADEPQIFRLDGETVRTPQVELLPRGSGSQGLTRRAPLTLKNSTGFLTPPQYIFNLLNILNGDPLTENPSVPTVVGQADAGLFLTVDITNEGTTEDDLLFLFDTGASVSAVSEVMAAKLGFDPVLDEPDFEVQVQGSGGTIESVPGFFADELKIATVGGSFTLRDVPLVVLDITDPSNLGNVVPGIIGTNLFTDRNLVIDPNPSAGGGGVGPSLYISDPITQEHQWVSQSESASWHNSFNWSPPGTPGPLWAAEVRSQGPFHQESVISNDLQIHRLDVAGGASGALMDVVIENGATLWVFGGVTVQQHGGVRLANGTLDAQFVDLRENATLGGTGTVRTEFENRRGSIEPGDPVGELVIEGVFANRDAGTLHIELGGTTPVDEFDVLTIDGNAVLGGTLQVSFVDAGNGLFRPRFGNRFEILRTVGDGSVIGEFDELLLPSNYEWEIGYFDKFVRLAVLDVLEVPGDYNGSGQVEQGDLDLVLLNWGAVAVTPPSGWVSDLPSGLIDQEELDRVLLNWGNTLGAASLGHASGVPEPTSMALLFTILVCGLATLRRLPRRSS